MIFHNFPKDTQVVSEESGYKTKIIIKLHYKYDNYAVYLKYYLALRKYKFNFFIFIILIKDRLERQWGNYLYLPCFCWTFPKKEQYGWLEVFLL